MPTATAHRQLPWITSPACTRFSKWFMISPHTSCTSRCPPRKDSEWRWWILGLLLKTGAIRYFLDTDGQKSGSYWLGWVPRRKNNPCDLMMGCASETFRKQRGSPSSGIFWCQWYHLNTAYVILIWAQLYAPICFVPCSGYWLMHVTNNEDYAKIWTTCILIRPIESPIVQF